MKKFVIVLALFLSACGEVRPAAAAPSEAVVFISQVQILKEHGQLTEQYLATEGTTHIKYLLKLINAAQKHGVKNVLIVDLQKFDPFKDEPNLIGYYDPDHKLLLVDIDLGVTNQLVHIMAHELGHHFQPPVLNESVGGQVFAETFAYLLCKRLGLDTFKGSSVYMVGFEEYWWVAQRYAKEIDAAVELVAKDLQ